jgi:hypothetical protein
MMQGRTLGVAVLACGWIALATLAPAADAPSLARSSPGLIKEKRLALVIGNAAYRDAPLANPLNDARDIARALADSSFQVTRLENASLREMRIAVRDFGDRLREQGGVGLFYFAGHGVQVKGRNYLIPIGADIEREDEVEFESLDANLVLEKLDSAGNRFNIVILDACRNNPFARAYRSATQGLAQMDAPSGTVVAFSTAPGSVASDGPGRNGLYTQHLVEGINREGLKVEEVFKQVRAEVRRDSGGKQTPWESTSLEGDFYFHPIDVAALEAARKREEQARLEAAIKVAIANERERVLKEIEEARRGHVGPAAAPPVMVATNEAPTPAPVPVPDAPAKLASAETTATPATELKPQGATAAVASIPQAEQQTQTVAGAGASAPATAEPKTVIASVAPLRPSQSVPKSAPETASVEGVIGTPIRGKIEAPRFEAGDEWEFLILTTNPANRAADPVAELRRFTATEVLPNQLRLENVKLDMIDAQPVENPGRYGVSLNLESGFLNAAGFSGNYRILSFPTEVGAHWSYSYEYGAASARRRDEMDSRVIGWEEVTVPAGTFLALKIDQWGWQTRLGPRVGWEATFSSVRKHTTIWYSPAVKYSVKAITQTYGPSGWTPEITNVRTVELVRFSGLPKRPDAVTGVVR